VVVAAAVLAAVMAALGVVVLATREPADASVLSRRSRGWLAARGYLEEKGCEVALLDRELDAPLGRRVLVLAFPWQHWGFEDVGEAIDHHLSARGDVVFAYAGQPFDVSESAVAGALDLAWQDLRPRPPVHPLRWRRYAAEEWWLTPTASARDRMRSIRISATRRAPRAPKEATVLAHDAHGAAMVFSFSRGRGRVVTLPADAFSNARLGTPGNADLLETLRQDLGFAWTFDEFHHGLRAPLGPAETGPQRVLLLYVAQVVFVYALAVFAVVRRFGPAWSEPAALTGSTTSFLLGLGALHHRLGHHAEAGRLIAARARELDPRLRPMRVSEDLLALARRVGEAQSAPGRPR
jgi:hypothetical protein